MTDNSKTSNSATAFKKGAFIKERYALCPHHDVNCKWRLGERHQGYEYLDNACYLSGTFKLDCPE